MSGVNGSDGWVIDMREGA